MAAIAALEKQRLYAKLLEVHGLGYAIYCPTRDIAVGDVGLFLGSDYSRCFNVFSLTREVSFSTCDG
jgi:hypothetical protein